MYYFYRIRKVIVAINILPKLIVIILYMYKRVHVNDYCCVYVCDSYTDMDGLIWVYSQLVTIYTNLFQSIYRDKIRSLYYSSQLKKLLSCGEDGYLWLWDMDREREEVSGLCL